MFTWRRTGNSGLLARWFGVRTGLAPLQSIRAALAAREPGAVHAELVPHVAAINALLARIGGALERERHFTGDAAHELRTPPTAVKTHIQVARLSQDSDGKDLALERAEEGVLRLQRSIEQLLMLARLDGPFPFDDDEAASAAMVAQAALAQIAPLSQCRVVVAAGCVDSMLAMPAALAVNARRNMLDNAIRYSPPDTEVSMRLDNHGGSIVFWVEDRGSGMSGQETARAAERFWRNGRRHGSGLGLSIVEAVAKRFGGDLKLTTRPGGGLVAQLRLPAAF